MVNLGPGYSHYCTILLWSFSMLLQLWLILQSLQHFHSEAFERELMDSMLDILVC